MNQIAQFATIKDIRQHYGVTAQAVAEAAGVPWRTEYLMEIGCPVSKEDARKVLHALSTLTGNPSLFARILVKREPTLSDFQNDWQPFVSPMNHLLDPWAQDTNQPLLEDFSPGIEFFIPS